MNKPWTLNGNWTEERVERLKVLWPEGHSAGDIAKMFKAEFGVDLTRNSIIGKIHRLDLPLRGKDATNLARNWKNRSGVKAVAKTKDRRRFRLAGAGAVFVEAAPFAPPAYVPPQQAWAPLPGITPVPFVDCPPRGCRWPIDMPEGGHWCCGDRAASDGPYCFTHRRLGTSATAKRTSGNELARSLRRYV